MLTIHQRREIGRMHREGATVYGICRKLKLSRSVVVGFLEYRQAHSKSRRFSSPELVGVPQLSDDEADESACPMNDRREAEITARIYEIGRSIQRHVVGPAAEAKYA